MFRVWDITLMICFTASVLFVGIEGISELPPPRNLTFKWKTPFTLHLTWEKPNLDCTVNYTVNVRSSQNCSSVDIRTSRRVQYTQIDWNISNQNGVCVSVAVNPVENCGNLKHSQYVHIFIPPPTETLVKGLSYEYFNYRLKCTWIPVKSSLVQDLAFYYWLPENNMVIKCSDMKTGECVTHDTDFKKIKPNMFFLFNGTYKGKPVNNTFMGEPVTDHVKISKPQLTISRYEHKLSLQTNTSDLDEFPEDCYEYDYTYSACDKLQAGPAKPIQSSTYNVNYDSNCKYKVRVQIIFSERCGKGKSDLSDEVEYGENRDPNLPALLAVIIIPLIVSCCLIVSLVLLRRHKDVIFPKIPVPTLILKDMLINNMKMPDHLQGPADVRLYVPIEEVVESRISLEPETPLVPITTNVTHKEV